jgi:AmiR/NasT family two-component response regulator
MIEQAKGILMATYRCGPEEAFSLLRRASKAGNIKIHVLAARLIAKASRGVTIV